MKAIFLIVAIAVAARFSSAAAPLIESTFTEIIHDVNTLSVAGNAAPAKVSDVLKAPDRVRTGPESRAELTAPDKTITRVGANTVFSYADNSRTLNLEQGNVLFHAPKGLGGGTIKSGGAAAAVLGTTLIVSATPNGGFKVILLEGKGKVTLPNGNSAALHAGQLVFVLPGGTLSQVLDINLGKLVDGSLLINGFPDELPSLTLILKAVNQQNSQLASGNAKDTGLPPGNFGGLDQGTAQIATPAPLSKQQYSSLQGGVAAFNQPAGIGGRNLGTLGFLP